MQQEQQRIKPLLHRDIRLSSHFTYRNFSKRGYQVIPKLVIGFDERDPFSQKEKMMEALRVSKKMKMIKKLDLSEFAIPYSKAAKIAKKMTSISCLKTDGKELIKLWPRYMKNLKSFSSSEIIRQGKRICYGYERSSQQQNRQLAKKHKFLSDYFKYLPKLEMTTADIDFSSDSLWRGRDLDYIWKFEQYPESIRRVWFKGTKYSEKPLNISMAHLKNLKDLKFEFGYSYYNSNETIQLVMELLPQVAQLEALHIDFIANFQIDVSICKALKSFTKLKKVRFSISWEDQTGNLKILEFLEDCPLEDLDFRVTIKKNESLISLISDFLSKKKDLKALKLRITNRFVFMNLKPIEDLLQVVDNLPQLMSFSFLTTVDTGGRRGYSYSQEGLSEINLSFDKLFARSVPFKKFRISLHQHSFSQNSFMKLLTSLKKFSLTLEKLRIDVGECKLKSTMTNDIIIDFIRSLQNIRSIKLYSLDVAQKAFFSELSEVIQSLKFLRVFCLGEISAKVTKSSFISSLKKILVKPGLEKFDCGPSDGLLRNNSSQTLDLIEIRKKNPYIKSWPRYPLFEWALGNERKFYL